MRRNNLADIPFCSNLKMRPACQTLSNAFHMSRKTPRTSYPSSSDEYISWVIDKSWLIQESPGLKPEWFVEIRWFLMKKLNISLYKRVQIFFHKLEEVRLEVRLFVIFLWTGTIFAFFHANAKIPLSKHDLKIIFKGFTYWWSSYF